MIRREFQNCLRRIDSSIEQSGASVQVNCAVIAALRDLHVVLRGAARHRDVVGIEVECECVVPYKLGRRNRRTANVDSIKSFVPNDPGLGVLAISQYDGAIAVGKDNPRQNIGRQVTGKNKSVVSTAEDCLGVGKRQHVDAADVARVGAGNFPKLIWDCDVEIVVFAKAVKLDSGESDSHENIGNQLGDVEIDVQRVVKHFRCMDDNGAVELVECRGRYCNLVVEQGQRTWRCVEV